MPDGLSDWLGEQATVHAFSLVIGALLAGLVGYLTTVIHASQEGRARRDVLITTLRQEIEGYSIETGRRLRFIPTMSNWQSPIPIGALDPLLPSDALDAGKDPDLIGLLVRLKKNTAMFNGRCNLINEHEYQQEGSYELRSDHHYSMLDAYMQWLAWRDAVVKELDRKGYGSRVKVPPMPEVQPAPPIYGPHNSPSRPPDQPSANQGGANE